MNRTLVLAAAGVVLLIGVGVGVVAVTHQPAGINAPTASGTLGISTPGPLAGCSPIAAAGPVKDVTSFGADKSGAKDSGPAILRALDAAEAANGVLHFPAGHYSVMTGGQMKVTAPVVIRGDGKDQTVVTEHQHIGLFAIQPGADGTRVENITLDTQSVDGLAAVGTRANNITVSGARILGGPRAFALYFAGPAGASVDAPEYNTCNQVMDTEINDQISDDGFSWSFQKHSRITNITHTGSRLAIYRDIDLVVDGYKFTPGSQRARNGFWVTPPSSAITIKNFTSSGAGGVIGASNKGYTSDGINIINETAAQALHIGDVHNLTLDGCSLAIMFDPITLADHITVIHSKISKVTWGDRSKVTNVTGL